MTTTTTTERPILFSGPMVRAILDGRKTQTRRVVKGVFPNFVEGLGRELDCIKDTDGLPSALPFAPRNWELCPYGVAGDQLWVRETWCRDGGVDTYKADGDWVAEYNATQPEHPRKWTPSIHMPRAACRLLLTVTDVRVERVQDISSFDAMNEGVASLPIEAWSAVGAFRQLWDSINAKRGFGWESNPWVWVVSFQREGGAL